MMRPLGNIATTGIFWVGVLNILVCLNERAEARLKKEELTPLGDDGEVIPEVNGKKLESLLETEEYLAVFFYTKICKTCESILAELEHINDDAERFGVRFVKNGERAVAKKLLGITQFPALAYYRNQEPQLFSGDLMDETAVLEWLTNLEAMELADKIEEVNGKILETLIKEKDYLAVLFYKDKHKESELVLVELENIDDEADQLGIGFVKTSEKELFDKYGLDNIPALAYYRKTIPLLYEGDLNNEEEVLKWLEEFKNVDDEDDDVIEDMSADGLESLIDKTDIIAVFVYDSNDAAQKQILDELETIDDDLDQHGIPFVKTDDIEFVKKYGFKSADLPLLIYFENGIPQFYKDDMQNEERIMNWLVEQKMEDEIEEVSEDVLQELIESSDYLAVLIYDAGDEKSEDVLAELESIDDECDQHDIPFVKVDDPDVVKQFGVDVVPALLYFEAGIPNYYPGELSNAIAVLEWLKTVQNSDELEQYRIYQVTSHKKKGSLLKEQEVLNWLIRQKESDEIEDVTPEILEALIQRSDYLAVLFYDRDDPKSQNILKELENIDDEADEHDLPFIKIDDDQVARDYGIEDELPCLVYFENEIPSIYHGDLANEDQVLDWLIEQINSDSIEEVTDKILENLVDRNQHVAVVFYEMKNKKMDRKTEKVIKELEEIDDEADEQFVLFLKTHDPNAAKKYGIEQFPTLVFFDREIPNIYQGDLLKEDEVLAWLVRQKTSEEIEEITEEMLKDLVEDNPKIVVLFFDKDVDTSKDVLDDLENIDDDLDKLGIPFVKIDDDSIAKDFGILDELPALVYFEEEIPSVYEGDLHNEDKALKWIIKQAQEDTIEEVTEEMLSLLVKEREYVLVFYAPDNCKECPSILSELEKIDDESDDHGVVFVTTDDTKFARKTAGVTKLPAIVLFRNGQPMVYKGDMEDEDELLRWLTSEDTLDIPDTIEQINQKMLSKLIENNDFVAVLFTKDKCSQCEKVLAELETIDDEAEAMDVDFVRVNDVKVARAYDIESFPAVIFFRKKFPQYYVGDLMDEDAVLSWITQQKERASVDEIEDVDRPMLEMLLDQMEAVTVVFYTADCQTCDKILEELENIDDDTDKYGIYFVKTDDMEYAKELGVTEVPSLVYFENHSPSIYFGDLTNEDAVLDWLIKQRTEDTIENINRDMLNRMIEETDYLAVFFYKARDEESQEILKALENIDDDCADYEVHLVAMVDHLMAKKYGIRDPPGLAYFRHGKHIKFTGDLYDPEEVLEWLTNPENMEMDDAIERVNKRMFERMLGKVESLAVFFYSKTTCKQCSRVLEELERIDDDADAEQIKMVKIDDVQLARKYGVYALPAFLFFRKDEPDPVIYAGDFRTGENMLEWMLLQKNPDSERIEELVGDELRNIIKEAPSVACYFYEEKVDCEECRKILEELENIDDDTERHGIKFVKSCDHTVAKELGIRRYPSLVYFEHSIPNIYEGDLSGEEEVLQWLITQKTEDTIETVNRDMLEKLFENTQYLGVFFYKSHCRACDQALAELERIDDETDLFGIHVVKIQDVGLAKRYGIKTFPALVYFRNGNPLIFEGDLKNEEQVLEWLTDDDNRELAGEIEEVNEKMLDRLIESSPFLAVLFLEEDCDDCERALKELENIDDEADIYGIDFVKINSLSSAAKFDITTFPSLAYFRKGRATIYDGDLTKEDKVLAWLTAQENIELKDEIEEVNRKMLEKLLDENDFVAVFFFELNNDDCDQVLKELEHIDDEAEELDIMLLKINDVKYARKYGINKVPAIVYFRRKFPSIFRGDLMHEEQVLEWLRKNRYRQPELTLFMYALVIVAVGFIGYTLFLIFCMKDVTKDKKE
ncbi:uncharacterized protein LOC111260507 isoform X2 [Varroa jacobsoni]|uniref:Thioredoxin domain-containing protein n=1 Tax=Varroa destructor TaxID=109461 RepID=A0A7M7JUJ9_VARDE|nr:uncharacterized protein LOC111246781 isoform X3 [Varroa destructor]XP_022689063.1 uncharacterized protein LOC111260507 isoform X2 [Varroa jacobsoni]